MTEETKKKICDAVLPVLEQFEKQVLEEDNEMNEVMREQAVFNEPIVVTGMDSLELQANPNKMRPLPSALFNLCAIDPDDDLSELSFEDFVNMVRKFRDGEAISGYTDARKRVLVYLAQESAMITAMK